MAQPIEVSDNGYTYFADLTANQAFTGTNKFGSTTNYTQLDTSGRLTMVGNARVLKEDRVDANVATKGSSAPTASTRTAGASGTLKFPVIQFSKVTQQDVYFTFHIEPDTDTTSPVQFHLMWIPGASYTTGNYVWKLEYLTKYEDNSYGDATITTGTPTTISEDVTPSSATSLIETHFATTISVNTSQVIMGHFYRDVAADNADDVGEVLFFEIEYYVNKLGEQL